MVYNRVKVLRKAFDFLVEATYNINENAQLKEICMTKGYYLPEITKRLSYVIRDIEYEESLKT